jgi:hypothetical protein
MLRTLALKLSHSRTLLLVLQLILSLVIGYMITTESTALAIVTVFFFAIFVISRTLISAMLSLFTGYVLSSFLMHFVVSASDSGQVSGTLAALTFTSVVGLTALVFAKLTFRKELEEYEHLTILLGILSSSALTAYWTQGGPGSALKLLSATGEDNAAWLQGLANSTNDSETVLTAGSSFGADYITGLIHALLRLTTGADGLFENAKVLQVR